MIQLSNVTVQYGRHTALKNINVTITKHDYITVIGPNGSGKSTLLKTLIRIIPHTMVTGKICIQGKKIEMIPQQDLARIMSYVPQHMPSSLPFTVIEFIRLGRYPHHSLLKPLSAEDKKWLHWCLEVTGLLSFKNRHINQLSGGERQKVLLAGALAQQPHILLLDEPTHFLDPKHHYDMHRLLTKLHKEYHLAIMMVTHNMHHILDNHHTLLALNNGQIAFCGHADDTQKHHIIEELFGRSSMQCSYLYTPYASTPLGDTI